MDGRREMRFRIQEFRLQIGFSDWEFNLKFHPKSEF
jgi:hypothetical protein